MPESRVPPRVRVAPSPTGDPHVGTAYVAQFNRTFAHKHGGQFVLRIEDTDRGRSSKESENAIYESLQWLGLGWDEGPDIGGPHAPYRQSERTEIYRQHVDTLIKNGAAYRCFCTPERLTELREQQKAEKASRLGYDGLCRSLSEEESDRRVAGGEVHVVRLRVPDGGTTRFKDLLRDPIEIAHGEIDDQVLLKSDGHPTYHLANVVDDHLMGITHVMRAEEWIPSTPKHILLYEAFGWNPPVFCHLPLLRNTNRSKISKRKNPTSLTWYRDRGFLPEALLNFLALMGWSPPDGEEIFTAEKFEKEFDPANINTTGPVFDMEKLEWLNGEYIRSLDEDSLTDLIAAFRKDEEGKDRIRTIVPLVRERMKVLADYDEVADYFYADSVAHDVTAFSAAKKMSGGDRIEALRISRSCIEESPKIDREKLESDLRQEAEAHGFKVGSMFMCLRIAVTGRSATPPLLESMVILGRETCLARISDALLLLEKGLPEEG